jgi:hypothetical protein
LLELKTRLNMLTLENKEKERVNFNAVTEGYKNLMSNIAEWEQNYVLKAPIHGVVSFFKFQHQYQVVQESEEVFTIVPAGTQKLLGRVYMPTFNSGKVKVGQRAIIKLNDYPYQEFGIIHGSVRSISDVAKSDSYAIELLVPEKLNTTYNKELPFRPQMQGQVEIVTEDLRLIERVYYQFRSMLRNNN